MAKKATKNARGRPKLNPGEGKEVTVRVRMKASMRDALRRAAGDRLQTVSEYVRDLIAREVDKRA